MKTTIIELDEHSACALAEAAKRELERSKRELDAIRKFRDMIKNYQDIASIHKDRYSVSALRCYLPATICNSSAEEICEQVDPWISLVNFWENWHEIFREAAKRED